MSPDIMSLERVSVVECVCHDREQAEKEFFICRCANFLNYIVATLRWLHDRGIATF